MNCPVCELPLTEPLPEKCPKCRKNLKYDFTLIPSLGKIPVETEKRYLKWLRVYKKFFKAKVQLNELIVEIKKIREDGRKE